MTGSDAKVVGWKLDRDERRALLERFPPHYAEVVADHVTFPSGAARDAVPPPGTEARIVGRADDGAGVEAMVVAIEGGTDRPDGSTWHVTWSLGEGRAAKESNDVIAERGWTALAAAIPIHLIPARWT